MMDRRIKERLIGATILVVLVVLIVPEMLSGPDPHRPTAPPLTDGLPGSTRTVDVDLSTSKATAAPDPADSASTASDAAASAAGSAEAGGSARSAAAPSDTGPTVTTLRAQKPADAPLETAASPPSSAGTGASARPAPGGDEGAAASPGRRAWSVQLGSFASRANADKLVRQLGAHGDPPYYVSASGAGASLRYRVRLGPLADRGAAERAAVKLRASGHAATVVAPAS